MIPVLGVVIAVLGAVASFLFRAWRNASRDRDEFRDRLRSSEESRADDAGRFEAVIADYEEETRRGKFPDDLTELRRRLRSAGGVPLPADGGAKPRL